MSRGSAVLCLLLVAACAGKTERAEPPSSSCVHRLAPRQGEAARLPAGAAPAPRGPSRIVVHAELGLGPIAQELEKGVERRVAEARNVDIGVAGVVHYTADRGPFQLSVENDSLIVSTEVRAHAEACARGRCYASCDPVAVARAVVPLRLDRRYRFGASRVTATFTRKCKVRALRGFLTLDVTPTIEARLAPELRRMERTIDRRLPALEAQAKELWAELAKPYNLPLGSCAVIQPRGIVQGPVAGDDRSLRLRFGLLAEPEFRARCGDLGPASPLPPLAQDSALPAEEEVELGLVMPLSSVASALEASTPGKVRIERAVVSAAGNPVDADLTLAGELCGDLSLRASLAWAADGRSLTLASPELASAEHQRLHATSLEPGEVTAALAAAPRIALPIDPRALVSAVPLLASAQSNAAFEVSAAVSSLAPASAGARGDDLVARVRVKGRIDLKQR